MSDSGSGLLVCFFFPPVGFMGELFTSIKPLVFWLVSLASRFVLIVLWLSWKSSYFSVCLFFKLLAGFKVHADSLSTWSSLRHPFPGVPFRFLLVFAEKLQKLLVQHSNEDAFKRLFSVRSAYFLDCSFSSINDRFCIQFPTNSRHACFPCCFVSVEPLLISAPSRCGRRVFRDAASCCFSLLKSTTLC